MSPYLGDLVKLENFNVEEKVGLEMTLGVDWFLSSVPVYARNLCFPPLLSVIYGATEAKATKMQIFFGNA